jgi:predicted aspartyl protease
MRARHPLVAVATILTAVFALPLSAGPLDSAESAPWDISEGDLLAFESDEAQRMTVPVHVTGSGPYRFLVDTGAERTVISTELAGKLQLVPGRPVTLHSMTEVADVPTAVIPSLRVSKKTLNDVQAPALSAIHMGAAGMLGVDSLQSQRVVFNFAKATMSIVPSRKMEEYWGPNQIVIKGRNLYGRLVLVDARMDGQKIVVIVDTGSPVSIGNNVLRSRLAARKRLKPTTPVELTSVTGGRVRVDYTTTRQITLGGVDIYDMPIGFAEVHPFKQLQLTDVPALLLGMDVLQLFERVSVDFARRQVRFKMPSREPAVGETISSRSRIEP